jgi:hypothetical protein
MAIDSANTAATAIPREVHLRNRETLNRLAALLADDDVQAVPLWHESASSLREAFDGRVAPFEAALNAYDFAAAHALLLQTLDELEAMG